MRVCAYLAIVFTKKRPAKVSLKNIYCILSDLIHDKIYLFINFAEQTDELDEVEL